MGTNPTYYQEVTFTLEAEDVEKWSDTLLEQGAISISIEDAYANTDHEYPLFGEPEKKELPEEEQWPTSQISILLNDNINYRYLISSVATFLNKKEPKIIACKRIKEQDWVKLTQSQFTPIEVGEKIIITPSWTKKLKNIKPIRIVLDPGLAFGTGSHPTTQLCIEWLESVTKSTDTVLDYGCGSGILAIVADFCGAKNVVGVDIDPNAILTSKQNSTLNQRNIKFYSVDECPNQQFDIVVANILSNPLKMLAPLLSNKLSQAGIIALSGILNRQTSDIINAYKPFIQLNIWKKNGEWVLLTGRKN